MICDFLDKHIWNVGDHQPGSGSCLDIDHVHTHAANADTDGFFEGIDHLLVDT